MDRVPGCFNIALVDQLFERPISPFLISGMVKAARPGGGVPTEPGLTQATRKELTNPWPRLNRIYVRRPIEGLDVDQVPSV
jgi:hypothetical protein